MVENLTLDKDTSQTVHKPLQETPFINRRGLFSATMVVKFESSTYVDYDKYLEYRSNQKRKDRERIKNYIKSLATDCLFCGSTDDLNFHHVNPNEKNVDVASAKSKKTANEEVVKCWCLCESCHTKLHQRLCDPLPSAYDTRVSVP